MFSRKLQVSVVKDAKEKKSDDISTGVPDATIIAAEVGNVVDRITKTIVTGLLVYIAADTARKVIVKSTPEGEKKE